MSRSHSECSPTWNQVVVGPLVLFFSICLWLWQPPRVLSFTRSFVHSESDPRRRWPTRRCSNTSAIGYALDHRSTSKAVRGIEELGLVWRNSAPPIPQYRPAPTGYVASAFDPGSVTDTTATDETDTQNAQPPRFSVFRKERSTFGTGPCRKRNRLIRRSRRSRRLVLRIPLEADARELGVLPVSFSSGRVRYGKSGRKVGRTRSAMVGS